MLRSILVVVATSLSVCLSCAAEPVDFKNMSRDQKIKHINAQTGTDTNTIVMLAQELTLEQFVEINDMKDTNFAIAFRTKLDYEFSRGNITEDQYEEYMFLSEDPEPCILPDPLGGCYSVSQEANCFISALSELIGFHYEMVCALPSKECYEGCFDECYLTHRAWLGQLHKSYLCCLAEHGNDCLTREDPCGNWEDDCDMCGLADDLCDNYEQILDSFAVCQNGCCCIISGPEE